MLPTILFTGKIFSYTTDESVVDIDTMFGFIKNQNGSVAIQIEFLKYAFIIFIFQKKRCKKWIFEYEIGS